MNVVRYRIDELTQPAQLVETLPDGALRCQACAHRCLIKPSRRGICQVRFNQDGILRSPAGYVAGLAADPVEKKPFNHFLPGSKALTFGMLGCNFHCGYCQNWFTSQALRDPASNPSLNHITRLDAQEVIRAAQFSLSKIVVSSYNEPFITAEWAREIFTLARQAGLKTALVSNGYATPQSLGYLAPVLDALKIDLKTLNDRAYRSLGGVLDPVLSTIQQAVAAGIWVEVVTLLVPGFNDSPEELWQTSRFLAGLNPDLPWHVTAFHPDYRMDDRGATQVESLREAAEIGQEAGLRYVYTGNIHAHQRSMEDTHCPRCQAVLIRRRGFYVLENQLGANGTCPQCAAPIPGIWA